MINITRTSPSPISLQNPEIQKYLDDLIAYKEDKSLPKPEPPQSYRKSDVLKALDECFYSKCYLTEQKYVNSWNMDIDHFVPKNEQPGLRYEWSNLYPADHNANMARPRKTPIGGYLDPASNDDDVEREILHYLPIGVDDPQFKATNSQNVKAVNTAQLLDLLHNGSNDSDSKEKAKHLKFLIRKKYEEVLLAIIAWQHAKENGGEQEKFSKETDLRNLLSRKSSFTMLLRSMNTVRQYVPKDFLD